MYFKSGGHVSLSLTIRSEDIIEDEISGWSDMHGTRVWVNRMLCTGLQIDIILTSMKGYRGGGEVDDLEFDLLHSLIDLRLFLERTISPSEVAAVGEQLTNLPQMGKATSASL